MPPASTLSTLAYIFKRKYLDGEVADMVQRDHPLFNMVPKRDKFVGDHQAYAIHVGDPQGISGTFANALANASSSKGKQPLVYRTTKYGVITISAEAMRASTSGGAFVDAVTKETDRIIRAMGNNLAFDLYRDGTGVRGRRSSLNGNVVTLAVPDDARNFHIGMTVVSDDSATGLSPNAGSTTVTAISLSAGTITLANAAAMAGFANNDYLFRDGDSGTCMEGLALCTPLTAPANGESFRGIDRSTYEELLAGVRINDINTSIEENVGLAAVKVGQSGLKIDKAFLNPINFYQVARRQNAKVEMMPGGTATMGFESLVYQTAAGSVRFVSDPDCPTNRFYCTQTDSHFLWHLDGLTHIVRDDGMVSLRQAAADGIEIRARFWGNYVQPEPGNFAVGAI